MLVCERLVVGYGGRGILPPIDLSLRRGSFLAVLGRNGSGKTTWIRTMLGLLPPVSGRVRKASPDVRIAYVPQATALDDVVPLEAREVVRWGRLSRWGFLRPFSTQEDRRAADEALRAAEADAFARLRYRELSRGQKQRVLFARMLATGAQVALLDEPTAAMDKIAERRALSTLAELVSSGKMAVAVVAHDPAVALEFADQAIFFDREGGVVVVGDTRTVLAHPSFRRHYGDLAQVADAR